MLKSNLSKKQSILDQEKNIQRLETDIAQLINENNSLKTQNNHLLSQLDYAKRAYAEKYTALLKQEALLVEKNELANEKASAIINKAYRNADIIIKEVLSASNDALKEISTSASYTHDISQRMTFKMQSLEHILSGIDEEAVRNLMLFNKDHDKFFKK